MFVLHAFSKVNAGKCDRNCERYHSFTVLLKNSDINCSFLDKCRGIRVLRLAVSVKIIYHSATVGIPVERQTDD